MDGRWGTVCNSNQEETAGAVCSQLGLPIIGSVVFVTLLLYVQHTHGSQLTYVVYQFISTLFGQLS